MRTVYSKVKVRKVEAGQYNWQAEISQIVSTFYPQDAVNAGHDELLPLAGEEKEYKSERVVWVKVNPNTTAEQVEKALTDRDCRIVRVLSHKPILEEGDVANQVTAEDKSRSQVVKDTNGEVVLKNYPATPESPAKNLPMFRRYYFKWGTPEDVDLRPETKDNAFIPSWFSIEQTITQSGDAYTNQTEDAETPFSESPAVLG